MRPSANLTFLYSWRTVIALAAVWSISGCALIQPVPPWQKGTLTRAEMTIQGNDPLGAKFNDHIYTSREAASGGTSVGGGGCGCN
jgi:hypothetical protein